MKKSWKIALGLLTAVVITAIGYGTYLGYIGGNVETRLVATGSPSPAKRDLVAVILSGDMGFKIGMGPKIGARLAEDGVPVIGINSLTYFRQRRTPAEITALIDSVTRQALVFGHAKKVILIGQSFGADMLHTGLANMPPDLRSKVRMVALVVPSRSLIYRASPEELFNWEKPDAMALPTARQLTWAPLTCVYGKLETDSLCPSLHLPNLHTVALPGGHLLNKDVDALYSVISQTIDQSAQSRTNITKS